MNHGAALCKPKPHVLGYRNLVIPRKHHFSKTSCDTYVPIANEWKVRPPLRVSDRTYKIRTQLHQKRRELRPHFPPRACCGKRARMPYLRKKIWLYNCDRKKREDVHNFTAARGLHRRTLCARKSQFGSHSHFPLQLGRYIATHAG